MNHVSDPPVHALMVDLLTFLAADEKPYADVMSAWRTSCPRLPVWEEAIDHGFVERGMRGGRQIVVVTARGAAFLERQG